MNKKYAFDLDGFIENMSDLLVEIDHKDHQSDSDMKNREMIQFSRAIAIKFREKAQ